jgi:DNA helicase-2/ATP-dependent DNA helicase PcrA
MSAARLLLTTKSLAGKGARELNKLLDSLDRWRRLVLEQGNQSEINRLNLDSERLRLGAEEIKMHIEGLLDGLDFNDAIGRLDTEQNDSNISSEMQGLINEWRSKKSLAQICQWDAEILSGNHVRLAETILDESGYTAMWQNDKTPEAPGRLENLKELVKALENFENLQGFLEHVSLIMDNEKDDNEPKVTLMTLHAAKGLEFPAVFLPGWEDGLFPSQRAMDEEGMTGLEEERRLAYVGITRAERVCTISFAGNRRVYGQWQSQMPSRFIDELPEPDVEVLTPPGLYGHRGPVSASASPVADAMRGSDLHAQAAKADVYNSPGWRRLQANQGRHGVRQPSEARNMTIDAEAISAFSVGDRVFHQKFGYGEVMSVEGDKLGVEFDKAGSKHVVGRFLVQAGADGDVPF